LAGVNIRAPPSNTIDPNPVIHDKSDHQFCLNGVTCPRGEDRTVTYRDGSRTTQRQMAAAAGMDWADTQRTVNGVPLISYLPPGMYPDGTTRREPRADFVTGRVNMREYLQWLRDNGYDLGDLQVQ
jgi:hypothetical protein